MSIMGHNLSSLTLVASFLVLPMWIASVQYYQAYGGVIPTVVLPNEIAEEIDGADASVAGQTEVA